MDLKKIVEKYASVKKLATTPLDSSLDNPVDESAPEPASAAKSHSTDESTNTKEKLAETEKPVTNTENEKQSRRAQTVDDKNDLDRLLDEVEAMFWKEAPPTKDSESGNGCQGEKEPEDVREKEERTYTYDDSDWESSDESDAEGDEKEIQNTKSKSCGSQMRWKHTTGK